MVLRSLDRRPSGAPVAPVAPGPRRSVWRLIGVVVALVAGVVALLPSAAAAKPGPEPQVSEPPPILSEGGTQSMRQQLNETQEAWLDAKVALEASVVRQQELVVSLEAIQQQIDEQSVGLGKIAHLAYVSAGYARISAIMATGVDGFLDGVGLIDALAARETNLIQGLLDARAAAAQAQAGIQGEIERQRELEKVMYDRNQQAEQALWRAAGGQDTEGFSVAASHVAVAAPRNADGSWPAEYIPRDRSGYPSVLERTVTGRAGAGDARITPRTAHAVRQSREAGFGHAIACYRSGEDGGQHPRGRACDFAVESCTFCGTVGGSAKSYGDQLAQFLVFNADRLGVLYVIWYRQIWLASTGRWKSYSGCCDPSSMHTNHVHLSMR
jgi:hypothetical protein